MQTTSPFVPPLNIVGFAKAFVAGALAVLIFQLGLAFLLSLVGLSPIVPYSMAPVPPLGIPTVLNQMFWGGLWGVVMLAVLQKPRTTKSYWITAIVFGSVVVTAVLLLIVFPLKGNPVGAGWNVAVWLKVLALHAAYGLGVGVFLRLLAGKATA